MKKIVLYETSDECLEFYTLVYGGFGRIVYINFSNFEPILSSWTKLPLELENVRKDVHLPTKKCVKKYYNIGDKVCYNSRSSTSRIITLGIDIGTIVKKLNEGFYVIHKNDPAVFVDACDMIPYNYYILHANCKAAMKQWLFVARRLNNDMNKDIRRLIALYIWELRNEYEWDF